MRRLATHIRSNVVAYLALFVALAGTSYAASRLPAGSVGNRELKNHSITPIKFDPTKIGASVRYWAVVGAGGHVLASRPIGARVLHWNAADAHGQLTWKQAIPGNCFPLGSVLQEGGDGGAANAGFVNLFQSSGDASSCRSSGSQRMTRRATTIPRPSPVSVQCAQP